MQPRHITYLILAALLPLLTACKGSRSAAGTTDPIMPGRTLSYEDSRRFDAYFLESLRQREKGNYDAQYELLTRALAVNPDAAEALYETALLKLSFGGFDDTTHRAEGEAMLHRAVALAPDNPTYKETLANQMAREGNYAGAINLYKTMVQHHPTTDNITALIALQEESADFAGAIESITRLEEIEGKNERYSLEKFRLYTQLGDNEHAYAAIEDLCAEYPGDLRYRVLMGDLYQQNGYNEMALAIYRDVLAVEPDNAYGQISLLAYYKKIGQDSLYHALVEEVVLNPAATGEAKTEALRGYMADNLQAGADSTAVMRLFSRALAMPQENRSLAELCVYYMMMRGMPEKDIKPVLEKLLETEPDYTPARMSLLNILLKKGDMKAVARLCHDGALYNPAEPVFYYYEAAALMQNEQNAEALERLQRGEEYIGEDTDREFASDYQSMLGDLYHATGDTRQAFSAYEKALGMKSDNIMCLNNYAYFLSLTGERLDDAATMSRRTVEAEPDNAIYLDTYAWILHAQRNYREARTYIDRALEKTPEEKGNASIFDHAGDIYYRCGERTQAVRFWVKALSLYETAKERAAVRNKVKRRRL